MDTSETYVKMCDCPEIQKQKPEGSQGEFIYCEGKAYQEMDDRPLTPFIWLPRQDQLQEMLGAASTARLWLAFSEFMNPPPPVIGKNWRGKEKYSELSWCPTVFFSTWEQLWLAFVMKKKHNKVWNGERWTDGN